MMAEGIRQLCALSVLCGVALCLTPEGGVKRITSVGCAIILAMSLLSALGGIPMSDYRLETAKYHELEEELTKQADELQERLNRTVIEQECEAYILDKAAELGISDLQVKVTARWSMEGVWIPVSVMLMSNCGESVKARLSERIQAELGVPAEQQEWSAYDG